MWTFERDTPVPLWLASARDGRVRFASTTRRGGVSGEPYHALNLGRSTADRPEAVDENRRRALEAFGLGRHALATAGQVHGTRVARVEAPGHVAECDALVTTRPGLALAITTADCLPVLVAAPGAAGVAHAGWRGVAGGLPAAIVAEVAAAAGCPTGELHALLGPCIRPCCYEVGPEVAERFPQRALRADGARPRLDLALAARLQLEAAGVPGAAIHDCGACTSCEPYWYFSYRRDGPVSGRHWSLGALAG